MKVSLVSVAIGIVIALAGMAAVGAWQKVSQPSPSTTNQQAHLSVPAQLVSRSVPPVSAPAPERLRPTLASSPRPPENQTIPSSYPAPVLSAPAATKNRNISSSTVTTEAARAPSFSSSSTAVPSPVMPAPASGNLGAVGIVPSFSSGGEELSVPEGYRLPSALMEAPASTGDAGVQALDGIAENFVDQLEQASQKEGSAVATDPSGETPVTPETWDDAVRLANEQYRAIYGFENADIAERNSALDAAQ